MKQQRIAVTVALIGAALAATALTGCVSSIRLGNTVAPSDAEYKRAVDVVLIDDEIRSGTFEWVVAGDDARPVAETVRKQLRKAGWKTERLSFDRDAADMRFTRDNRVCEVSIRTEARPDLDAESAITAIVEFATKEGRPGGPDESGIY